MNEHKPCNWIVRYCLKVIYKESTQDILAEGRQR